MNNKDIILNHLSKLGLPRSAAKTYLYLLEAGASSHLAISRGTGINRTKIYRIVDDLEKTGLATTNVTDSGKHIAPADPSNLEAIATDLEAQLEIKRNSLDIIIPTLKNIHSTKTSLLPEFKINTYDGVSGMKQMLWNELKTKDELLVFGSGTIEDLVQSRSWAEKHRQKTVDTKYTIREINNHGKKPINFTKNENFHKGFRRRNIDSSVLNLDQQIAIYNDVVATYHWRDDQKVGVEIINQAYSDTMRQVFEQYWNLSTDLE
ncbi:hypothetical protein KA068_01410 [Candidatus Saccharibacteria bacterium]|nr:hypothetical protein [Candidatus Saccharibacteria bacterium]